MTKHYLKDSVKQMQILRRLCSTQYY